MKKTMTKRSDMMKTLVRAMLVGFLLVRVSMLGDAQQQPGPAPASAPPLTIGPGDLLDELVFGEQELSGHFRVDEKGYIGLPLIGNVQVQGLTAEQAGKLIEKLYVEAQILRPEHAQAAVFIEEYANQGITVVGQVKSPGVFPALGVRMLNDVLAAAGGPTGLAASKVVITRKAEPQNPITVEYNPEALHPVIPAIQIFPGDSVTVPRAGIVYVVGNVNRSGGFVLDGRNTLTAEVAMGLAGGTGHGADVRHVRLVRGLPDGSKVMIVIPMDQVFKGKSPDLALKDGDILFVPTSTGKLALEQAISSAIGIGSSVAIYKTAYQ
jgi:polysaccharide export outer membrane protein